MEGRVLIAQLKKDKGGYNTTSVEVALCTLIVMKMGNLKETKIISI